MQDAKNNHRDYGMDKKIGSGLRHNRTLLEALYQDMFCVMGTIQLITWVLTLGRDTGLDNVTDLN